jgi:hypothetical protein
MKDSIFIPIAACNERFIEQTVRSALHNAKHPEKVFFGIFNNITDTTKSLLFNDYITKNSQIFYTELVSVCAMGVGFGRLNASLLQFREFDYMFQIDAHTLFTKNWDERLINVFNLIKTENNIDENKIVLSSTSAISWFNSTEDPYRIMAGINGKNFIEIDPYNLEEHFLNDIQDGAIKVKMFYDGKQGSALLKENIGFPIVYGERRINTELEYEETNGVHATFMFSKANLNRDVLHDPEDFFHGDQTNYSVRLLSRGYRIFSPKYPVISCLDKARYDDKEYDWRHSKDTDETNGPYYLNYKNSGDREFFNDIISGRYFGYWGAPDQESLELAKEKIEYTELGG